MAVRSGRSARRVMALVFAAGCTLSASSAAVAGAATLQVDLDTLSASAGGAFGGLTHTGTIALASNQQSTLTGITINGAPQTFTGSLAAMSGAIELSAGAVQGGMFTLTLTDGSSMTSIIGPPAGQVQAQAGQGYRIDGLTTSVTFTNLVGGTSFGGVDVAQFGPGPLTGSFLALAYNPDAQGVDTNTDLELYAAAAGPVVGTLFVNAGAPGGGNGSSWQTAFNSLEDALAVARAPGSPIVEIWVASGVYKPTRLLRGDPRSATFELPGGVAIHGGFAGNEATLTPAWYRAFTPTILHGDLVGDDDDSFDNYFNNAYHVCVYGGGEGGLEAVTLTGIDIKGGSADDLKSLSDHEGGAIRADGGLVVFEHGRLYRNQAYYQGGAIASINAGLHLRSAQVFNNRSYFGGGVSIGAASRGDGLAFASTFTTSAFSDNVATLLGYPDGNPEGGALYNGGQTLTVTNCTIANNSALTGGGVYTRDGVAQVANSILWGNSHKGGSGQSAQLFVESGDVTVLHSCLQGLDAARGEGGNIGLDPRFRAPSLNGPDFAGDFHLAVDTPCIDLGLNDVDTDIAQPGVQPLPVVGIFGRNRIEDGDHLNGATVDMGFSEIAYFEQVHWIGDGGTGSINSPASWYGGAVPRLFDVLDFGTQNQPFTVYVDDAFEAGLASFRRTQATLSLSDDLSLTYQSAFPQVDPSLAVDDDGTLRVELTPRGKGSSLNAEATTIGLFGDGTLELQPFTLLNTGALTMSPDTPGAGASRLDLFSESQLRAFGDVLIGGAPGRTADVRQFAGASFYHLGKGAERLTVGGSGLATWTVDDGSSLFVDDTALVSIGANAGSSGDITVTGPSSADFGLDNVIVGEGGSGRLRSLNGGTVSVSAAYVIVGESGEGTLESSGDVATSLNINASDVVFGLYPGSSGRIEVGSTGIGTNDATLDIEADNITFGLGGTGSVNLRFDNPTLTTNALNGVQVAQEPGSSAAFRLYSGAMWNDLSPAPIRLGVAGVASVLMDPGAAIHTAAGIEIGPGSSIVGQSTIVGDVLNTGIIDPAVDNTGLPWGGRLTIDGDYTQLRVTGASVAESGALIIRQGGAGAEAHSGLVVTGTANLGGGLFVQLDPGFTPAASNQFDMRVLEAGAISGAFDVAYFPGFPDTRFMRLSYTQGAALADGSVGAAAVVVTDVLESGVQYPGPQNFPAPGEPNWAALADFDQDGDVDLVITIPDVDPMMPGNVAVLFNAGVDGMGTWLGFSGSQQFACGAAPAAVVAADFSNDNIPDIAVANTGDDDVSIYTNDGAANFTRVDVPTGADEPIALAVVDVDDALGDDLAVAHRAGQALVLLVNDGLRAMNPRPPMPMQGEGTSTGGGGLDEDKDVDISVSIMTNVDGASQHAVQVFYNDGSANFPSQTFPAGDGATSVVVADLDLDGVDDVVTADSDSNTVSIMLNDGAGALSPPTSLEVGDAPPSLAGADIDNDGDQDLAVVATGDISDGTGARVLVLRNNLFNGQLAFAPAASLFGGTDPEFVLTGDVDNDNDADIISLNDGTVFVAGRGFEPIAVELTLLFLAGDANLDGVVDMLDLNIVLSDWTMTGPNVLGDVNHDGVCDFEDLNIVLAYYGSGR